jgi:hypothetical protein
VVGGKLVNSKSVEGKLVISIKMGGKLVICRYKNESNFSRWRSTITISQRRVGACHA